MKKLFKIETTFLVIIIFSFLSLINFFIGDKLVLYKKVFSINFGASKIETLKEKYDKAPQVIKDKYKLEKNTFKMMAKDDARDRIETEIGGDGDKFEPTMKIKRWDDEVNLAVKLKDTEKGNEEVSFKDNKIVYKKGNKEVNFYDLPISAENSEGGYEFEVILKEKPVTNKIEFTLNTKGLDFFYQPELTQKEKDKGNVRPENVVGSYAVYASEQKTNWTGGKLYRAGKVGHIFRPKIIDSAGKETWGILNIDKGILSIEIPQKFLDEAVYPVIVDPTFGYTTAGASDQSNPGNIYGYRFTGGAGTGNSMTAYIGSNGNCDTAYALYKQSDLSKIQDTIKESLSSAAYAWRTQNFESEPTVDAIDYYLVWWTNATSPQSNYPYMRYDSGTANYGMVDTSVGGNNFETWPATLTLSTQDNQKYSIYATYTAAGTSSCTPPATGDWYVVAKDNCYVSSNTTIQGNLNIINTTGPGSFNIIDGATLSVHKINNTSTPINVETTSGAKITLDNQGG